MAVSHVAQTAQAGNCRLLTLPSELIHHIYDFLSPLELFRTGLACRRLYRETFSETQWSSRLRTSIHKPLTDLVHYPSYRELYTAHFPFWFLTKHKVWYGDVPGTGVLVICRYSPGRDCIEGYRLIGYADAPPSSERWEWNPEVVIYSFKPRVRLNLDRPMLKLEAHALGRTRARFNGTKISESMSGRVSSQQHDPNKPVSRLAAEVHMPFHLEQHVGPAGLSGSLHPYFMLSRSIPQHLIGPGAALWPPLIAPSPTPDGYPIADHDSSGAYGCRMRNASVRKFYDSGHKPSEWRDVSSAGFRVRTLVQLREPHGSAALFMPEVGHGANVNLLSTIDGSMTVIGDNVTSFGTIDEVSYTATASKPWRGIWVGDYSSHGCEFVLILQPDDAKPNETTRPLPYSAARLIEAMSLRERIARYMEWKASRQTQSPLQLNNANTVTDVYRMALEYADDRSPKLLGADAALAMVIDGFEEQSLDIGDEARADFELWQSSYPKHLLAQHDNDDFQTGAHHGRIEAIKLTGDPNVPRGEYTFIAPDIGPDGLVRIADEEIFKGARVVRSVGHIATHGFQNDGFTESQLILIDHNTIAQFWKAFKHISYYRRVDIDQFLNAD